MEKTAKQVASIMEQKGAMGLALEVLATSSVSRTQENYQQLKKKLLSFPTQKVETKEFKKNLEEILEYEELMFVTFKKRKRNSKIGHKKEYSKGFCYYIGFNPLDLSKIYVHWKEDKKFLFNNIDSLKSQYFHVEINSIDCIQNIFCGYITLFNYENKKEIEAEISLYVGYGKPKLD